MGPRDELKNFNSGKKGGFITLLITILILITMTSIGISIAVLIIGQHKISANILKSTQAYWAAESGIEDALLRLSKKPGWAKEFGVSYSFQTDNAITEVVISNIIGGSRSILSKGDVENRIRKIETTYEINADNLSFHYGAQVGEGGMVMYNNSEIIGNVFSDGSIILNGGGKGIITGEVIVASTSTVFGNNQIRGLDIGGDTEADAYAFSCENCQIGGKLYLLGGGEINCITKGGVGSSGPIAKEPLPITKEQIDSWKAAASSSEIHIGDYEIGTGETQSFGPRKIEGTLTLRNNSTLLIKGTIWVTGTTTIGNNAIISLDPDSYGSRSGVLIIDGRVIVENGAILKGSGQEGSYLMLLSTNNSLSEDEPAIFVKNNSEGAIFYTNNGLITLNNNMDVREVTGYKILLKPNAQVEYKTGLGNILFTSGPGGSWRATSWREVE